MVVAVVEGTKKKMRRSEIIELWRNKKGGKVNKTLCLEMEMASLPSNSRFHPIYLLEELEFLYQKAQKKFQAPGENRTHDPPSSSSYAPTLSCWTL